MTDESEEIKNLFGFVAPSQEQLSTISQWARQALELQSEIETIEAHLKQLNKELTKIEEIKNSCKCSRVKCVEQLYVFHELT